MQEYMESNPRVGKWIFHISDFTKYLEFLFKFDDREAIKFHRQYLAKPFGELYRKLTQRDVPITLDTFVTEGIRKFLEIDIFLSPRTSFPMDFPCNLLFGRPFERLYSNFILCEEDDIRKMVLRAYVVYSNFIGVVSSGVEYLEISATKLEALLKQYIFYWNVASQNLDSLYKELKQFKEWYLIFSNDRESTIYYIFLHTTSLEIIDIADGLSVWPESLRNLRDLRDYPSQIILNFDDSTKEIRCCDCFAYEGLETEKLSYEDVLSGIKSKLKNATRVDGDGNVFYATGFEIVGDKLKASLPDGRTLEIPGNSIGE